MLYELRHYDIRSPRGLDRVNERFEQHVIPIWNRIGIEPVGFWPVIIGSPSPRLTYILAWEDLAQRQSLWDAFEADPEWRKAVAETNAAWGGSPIHTFTSSILKPTAFSRLPRRDNQPARLRGGIFELRTYHFEETAHLSAGFGLVRRERADSGRARPVRDGLLDHLPRRRPPADRHARL